MASKSAQHEPEKGEVIEELLGVLDKTLDRVKVLYEQFFLGMQKQAPTHLHNDVERKLRDLTQMQIRNTALRYRFATLQQKFGSYNSYWRRTLKQIEKGTYHRNLSKLSRQAATTGEEIPDEILAAMPQRMRDQVKRDREVALARIKRRDATVQDEEFAAVQDEEFGSDGTVPTRPPMTMGGAHVIDASDGEFDLDAYFASVTNDDAAPTPGPAPAPAPAPTPAREPQPAPAARPSVPLPDRRATPPTGVPFRPQVPPTGAPTSAPPAGRPPFAPSQISRPIPVMPGASARREPVAVETMSGPFPREPRAGTPPAFGPPIPPPPSPAASGPPPASRAASGPPIPPPRTTPPPPPRPGTPPPTRRAGTEVGVPPVGPRPPGMTDADVNALYAKYVKAKEAVGEPTGPGAYGKLLRTINAQAPKIMEQYKAKGVDFQVVVKDNQVVIRAKPKP